MLKEGGGRKIVRLILFFLLLFHGHGKASDDPAFTLLHPPQRSTFTGTGLVHLVVEVSKAAHLSVRLNGKVQGKPRVTERTYHYTLRLDFGSNKVEVEAVEEKKILAKETRELFFFSVIAKEKEIPPGFVQIPFHETKKAPKKCVACHILEPQKTDRAPASPSESSCHVCHKGLLQFRQVHGPAALWNCLACHNPETSPARYATPVPVRDLCYRCHTDQKDYFFSSPYQHGPTATGMCTICHNPHASDNEFWLKKPPWDLCTTCHTEKASGRHVIAWGPSGDTHPTRGRPDPMKPEREFSCRSCHNPHASKAPKLWNFNATTYMQLCQTCHNK
ncbi:MAG: hypothetical protein HY695_02030 [Deltaproteobacteria bacterium]|nr:hypothetical protein [Deltaproteobacteria bacterium]